MKDDNGDCMIYLLSFGRVAWYKDQYRFLCQINGKGETILHYKRITGSENDNILSLFMSRIGSVQYFVRLITLLEMKAKSKRRRSKREMMKRI